MSDHPLCPSCYVVTFARASAGKDALSLPGQHRVGRLALDHVGYADLPVKQEYEEGQKRLSWPKRVETHKLLAHVTDPCCRAIGVWREDRLVASAGQSEHIYEVLEGYGVELVEHDNGIRVLNPRNEGEELVRSIEASQSRQYIRKQRRTMYDTNRDKFLNGQHVTRPPFGTRKEVVLDEVGQPVMHGARSRVVKKQLVVDESAMELVRHFYEHVAGGGLFEDLEEECERLGLVGQDGGRWSRQRIRKLIANEFYKGVMVHNVRKTVHTPGAKPIQQRPPEEWLRAPSPLGALVDPALWEKANQVVAARWHVRGGGRGYRTNDPRSLDGLVFHVPCSGRMYPREQLDGKKGAWRRTGRFSYYCNGTTSIYSPCRGENASLSEAKIYAALEAYATGVGERMGGVVVEASVMRVRYDESAELRLRKALARIAGRLEREKDLYADGDRTKAEYEKRKAGLLAERAELEQQMADLTRPHEEVVTGPAAQEAFAALAALVPLLRDERLPWQERQLSAGRLIERILIEGGAVVGIEFKDPSE